MLHSKFQSIAISSWYMWAKVDLDMWQTNVNCRVYILTKSHNKLPTCWLDWNGKTSSGGSWSRFRKKEPFQPFTEPCCLDRPTSCIQPMVLRQAQWCGAHPSGLTESGLNKSRPMSRCPSAGIRELWRTWAVWNSHDRPIECGSESTLDWMVTYWFTKGYSAKLRL